MKTALITLALLVASSVGLTLQAQVPDWEDAVRIPTTQLVVCATSDTYGRHILLPNGLTYKHLLLATTGWQSPPTQIKFSLPGKGVATQEVRSQTLVAS